MHDPDDPQTKPNTDTPTSHIATPDPRLLELLVCPLTKTTLQLSDDGEELISRPARLAFPIRDGVAMLTVNAARQLNEDN